MGIKIKRIKKGFKKDPVCEMIVPEKQNALVYQGMHFAFCSQQCRERFLETPHLYIGSAGHKAPKQEGIELIKKRILRLEQPLKPKIQKNAIEAISEMMGIKKVKIEGDRVWVRYDLMQAKLTQIERILESSGGVLRQQWFDRFSRGCTHYFEENESQAMSVSPGSGKSCH